MTTWYEATAERGPARPALSGETQADVCVIGGGLAGIVTALELARRAKRVVLLEAERLAWAASGRNGGFVSNGFAEGIGNVEKRLGLDAAQALYRLSGFGTEYLRREIETLPGVKSGDGSLVARRTRDPGIMALRDMMERRFNEKLIVFSVEETRARLNSARYFEGLFNPRSFQVHPLRMALGLAERAEAAGTVIHENSHALSVTKNGPPLFRIATSEGAVTAEHVVHCVSALDRALHRATGRAILPVATYVAVTAPMAQDAIAPGLAYGDTRRAGDYYRIVDDGRILWGGRITTRVAEPTRLAERMKGDMVATFPQLGGAVMEYAWPGIMGYAVHRMPLIGRDSAGQWFATAFGGHGLNTTAMAGQLIARAIADGDDEYRRFAAYGPRWAGGPLGRFAVQGSYWWMQLRDRIDER